MRSRTQVTLAQKVKGPFTKAMRGATEFPMNKNGRLVFDGHT
jgi:hypothetical protein